MSFQSSSLPAKMDAQPSNEAVFRLRHFPGLVSPPQGWPGIAALWGVLRRVHVWQAGG